MKKSQLLCLCLFVSSFLSAQNTYEPQFTAHHRSTTLLYGVSATLGMGGFAKDAGATRNYTFGPLSLLFNKALTEDVSLQWGPSVMYYGYKYNFQYDGYTDKGSVNLLFGGLTVGVNYHVEVEGPLDPYLGISAGAGYFHDIEGGKDNSYSLGGSIPLLYGAKVGANIYGRSTNAWTIELGYDYLSYLKVGYTFVKSK